MDVVQRQRAPAFVEGEGEAALRRVQRGQGQDRGLSPARVWRRTRSAATAARGATALLILRASILTPTLRWLGLHTPRLHLTPRRKLSVASPIATAHNAQLSAPTPPAYTHNAPQCLQRTPTAANVAKWQSPALQLSHAKAEAVALPGEPSPHHTHTTALHVHAPLPPSVSACIANPRVAQGAHGGGSELLRGAVVLATRLPQSLDRYPRCIPTPAGRW